MESQPLTHGDDSSSSAEGNPQTARYQLNMSCADGSTRTFLLSQPKTVIGRQSRCDVQVGLPIVAKQHAALKNSGTELLLTDLGSESGTFVNGQRITTAVLRHGDRIGIGPTEFTIHDLQQIAASSAQASESNRASSAEVVVLEQRQQQSSDA